MENFEENIFVEISSIELKLRNGGILSRPSFTMSSIFCGSFHAYVDFTEGLMSEYN